MNRIAKRFVKSLTILGGTATVGALLLVGGCGGGGSSAPAATTKTNTIPAGTVTATNGTLTVAPGATVTAVTSSNVTAISIPAGVTIVPPAGQTFTAATTIDVKSFDDVSELPDPITPGFKVDKTDGSVDVTFGGLSGVTFTGGQATISIPLTGVVTSCEVFVNKNNGTGYKSLGQGDCSNGTAKILVSDLCTYCVNPHFKNKINNTGSTGSGGSTGF